MFFLVFNLFGCGSNYEEALINEKSNNPDQESWGVTIILTDGGIIRAKVKSGHLEKYNEKEFILLDSMVIVDFYDKQELHTSTLTSTMKTKKAIKYILKHPDLFTEGERMYVERVKQERKLKKKQNESSKTHLSNS